MRVMMIGAYPRSPQRIDGGVAAAMTYLSAGLAAERGIDLIGVRTTWGGGVGATGTEFPWPVVDLSLGRFSLSSFYVRQVHHLMRLVRQFRPDVVHGQGTDIAGHLAVRSGLPSVVTVHGLLAECAKFQTDRMSRWRAKLVAQLTERTTVRRATTLIAISPFVRQYYASDISGSVYEIPNAVAASFFDASRTPERGRVLFAGRIANGKGLVELLRAASTQLGYVKRIILAGATPDPDYRIMLQRISSELGLSERVEFVGLLGEHALLREFERAEVLVLPSFQETAPMVIQQAMAAGLAVIATRVGGIPFQVEHGASGLLFDAGDVAGLAALFSRLGSDAELSPRLGRVGKQIAISRYRVISVARATIGVYESLLGGNLKRSSGQ
jgi:glycosyltransferase involved in cell wall biosynthesis